MTIYQKSNRPTNTAKALQGRIEDVLHGYTTGDAKAALTAVTLLVDAQDAQPETVTQVEGLQEVGAAI
jgi:replication-associated recombination protein RarA